MRLEGCNSALDDTVKWHKIHTAAREASSLSGNFLCELDLKMVGSTLYYEMANLFLTNITQKLLFTKFTKKKKLSQTIRFKPRLLCYFGFIPHLWKTQFVKVLSHMTITINSVHQMMADSSF